MKGIYIIILAAAVVLAGLAAPAEATLFDSNSIIKDNIEYYMQTDKTVYVQGEDVQLLYRVTNLWPEYDVAFFFSDQMQYKFKVNYNGDVVWFKPKAGLPATSYFLLGPGESREYTATWDMTNWNGTPYDDSDDFTAVPGIYEITGSLHPVFLDNKGQYVPVSVQIEIVPEPGSIVLFAAGLAALSARNSKRRRYPVPR